MRLYICLACGLRFWANFSKPTTLCGFCDGGTYGPREAWICNGYRLLVEVAP